MTLPTRFGDPLGVPGRPDIPVVGDGISIGTVQPVCPFINSLGPRLAERGKLGFIGVEHDGNTARAEHAKTLLAIDRRRAADNQQVDEIGHIR